MKPPIRVLLVEDETLVREALRILLEQEESITLVGQAENAEAALHMARLYQPDLILLDLHLPDKSGVVLISELRQQDPSVRILVVTGSLVEHEVASIFRAGAAGYLLKTQTITDLITAIEQICQGQAALHPIAAHSVSRGLSRWPRRKATTPLSRGEQHVLHLVAQGFANKEIATRLALAETTVHVHLTSVLRKLRLKNRTQAALYALQHNWIQPDEISV